MSLRISIRFRWYWSGKSLYVCVFCFFRIFGYLNRDHCLILFLSIMIPKSRKVDSCPYCQWHYVAACLRLPSEYRLLLNFKLPWIFSHFSNEFSSNISIRYKLFYHFRNQWAFLTPVDAMCFQRNTIHNSLNLFSFLCNAMQCNEMACLSQFNVLKPQAIQHNLRATHKQFSSKLIFACDLQWNRTSHLIHFNWYIILNNWFEVSI